MNLRLQSIADKIIPSLKSLFKRFPVSTVLIILEAIGFIFLIESTYLKTHPREMYAFGIALMGNYVLTFFTISLQLAYEKMNRTGLKKVLAYVVLFVAIISFVYVISYRDIFSYEILQGAFTGNTQMLMILMGLATLSPFILPFIEEKESKQWWNFTLTSITQAIISGLYSVAIFVGLTLALFAVESFWKFRFFENQYAYLAILSFVLILPLHFLHNLYDLAKTPKLIELPKFLFILVKYILTPLIAIYTVILYPYIFSFPFKSEWPANIATWVILALLVMVYLGVVLMYGIKEKSDDEKFKKLFIRVTTAITIPTIIFWAYSLYLRINAYGMSITRFVLMSIILWFLAISITYFLKYKTNVKYLVGSFFVLIFCVYFLPFTSYFWAERSQTDRLINIANDERTYVNNVIVTGDKAKVDSDYYEMQDILSYINKNFGLDDLKPKLSSTIIQRLNINQYGYAANLTTYSSYLNDSSNVFFNTMPDNLAPNSNNYFYIILDTKNIALPSGYTKVNYYEQDTSPSQYQLYPNRFAIDGNKVSVHEETFDIKIDTNLQFNTIPVYAKHDMFSNNKYTSDVSLLSFLSEDKKALLVITNIYYSSPDGKADPQISAVAGYVFSK